MIKIGNKNEGTQVSDVSTGCSNDNSITIRRKRIMNENSNGTQVEDTLTPKEEYMKEASGGVTNPTNPEPKVPYPNNDPSENHEDYEPLVIPPSNDSYKFTDQKYMDILDTLKSNDYPNAQFFGTEGYFIPDPDGESPLVRLVCRNISEGFKVNVIGGLYDIATSTKFAKQLNKINNLANKLNEILLQDQPDINEMIESQLEGDPLND